MQTFLPYKDFARSLDCLDPKRLGKQRVEAEQILRALKDPTYGWQHHPAVKMWRGFEQSLVMYRNTAIRMWTIRGYRNSMSLLPLLQVPKHPWWLGNEDFHKSHQSNLLRKDYEYYSQFNWGVSPDLPYIWPGKDFKDES